MNLPIGVHRTILKIRKYSPEIMLIVGVSCTVAGTVLACVATQKQDIIGVKRANKIRAHKDEKQEQIKANAEYVLETTKNFGPSVAISAVGYGLIFGGHHMIYARNIALGASLATLQGHFNDYRNNVRERYGEDVDKECYNNVFEVKQGKGKNKEIVKVVDPNMPSIYSKFFDDCSTYWNNDADMNLSFLYDCQRFANDKLKSNGHVFLNEVYDMLDIPRTSEGAIVGWVLNDFDDPCDDYISFGIYDAFNYDREKQMFVNGYEKSILLDFNVDGVIWDLI